MRRFGATAIRPTTTSRCDGDDDDDGPDAEADAEVADDDRFAEPRRRRLRAGSRPAGPGLTRPLP